MDYQEYFVPYASEINLFLDKFFKLKITSGKKTTPIAADIWEKLQGFVAGGKRIRGGLVRLGYECFAVAPSRKILPVSAAVELSHGAILIHDDILDQSVLRHGRPTIHKQYESYHRRHYRKGEPHHYGESMAISVGVVGYYGGISLIAQSNLPEPLKVAAIEELARFMTETGYGEALDVDLACREKIAEKDVLTIHTLKTAQYTIVGPLKIGGLLAGASRRQLKGFEEYGIPVGIAFQLQDDILGIYGDEKELGKSIGDDIAEGKNTLLYTQALKKGNSSQRKKLMSLWGKKGIAVAEVDRVRQIIKETGSLEYSQKLARKLAAQGKKAVSGITQDQKLQEIFLTLTDFILQRSY